MRTPPSTLFCVLRAAVITRIMDIVGLPHDHAEHMQLLKYGPGEYYRLHHDWIPEQLQASRCARGVHVRVGVRVRVRVSMRVDE